MISVFVEVTNGPRNWGKFLVSKFTADEFAQTSAVDVGAPLLGGRGWAEYHILVVDLQIGEGAIFRPGGMASADLQKHRIWVCPMFEPFLEWLYLQDLEDLTTLPKLVDLPDAEFQWSGYRRPGRPGPLPECEERLGSIELCVGLDGRKAMADETCQGCDRYPADILRDLFAAKAAGA